MQRGTQTIGIALMALCTFSTRADAPTTAPFEVLESIRLAEYDFSAEGSAFSAPNRAHGFRTFLSTQGLVLTDRVRGEVAWRIEMLPVRFGRGGRLSPIEGGTVMANRGRIEHQRPELVEWYVSSPIGLEQGFDVVRPPAGDSTQPLVLELAVGGTLTPRLDGQGIVFESPKGTPRLRYDGLLVRDARGEAIGADLTLKGRTVQIRVHDEMAAYPLIIDPLFTNPEVTIDGPGAGDQFGFSVASANVNGDDYTDLIVGAPTFDGGQTDEGKVFVYHGSAMGLDTTPDWIAEFNQPGLLLGHSVASAGDVSNDTFEDIIVGAPGGEGFAYIWHGSDQGLGADGTPSNAASQLRSNQAGAQFGWAVGGGGSLNGDAWDDVIVGAPAYENSPTDEGWVFVWHGSPDGIVDDGDPSNADWSAQSNHRSGGVGAALGYSVAIGNVNGDPFDDAIVGAPFFHQDSGKGHQGRAFVWLGSSSGLGSDGTPDNSDWKAKSNVKDAHFGWSVLAADVDGDGIDDVAGGAPHHGSGGAVFLWLGSSSGLGNNGDPANADWDAGCAATGAEFGSAMGAADLVDSGSDSLLVGAPEYVGAEGDGGAVFAWYGCPTVGLGADSACENADWESFHSDAARLGQAVAGADDVNGDGFADAVAGASGYSSSKGQVLVFHGNGNTPSVSVIHPNGGTSLNIGTQVTLLWSATAECSASVPTVDIELSRNGPNGPFELLFDNTANDGSQPWLVSGPETPNAFLRVRAPGPGATLGEDLSDAAFTISSDTSCGPCTASYCQSEGTRCNFNGSCGAGDCCNYSCGPDPTCTVPDPIPPDAC